MITVISGTNRPDSYTAAVSAIYCEFLTHLGAENKLLSLTRIPHDLLVRHLKDDPNEEMRLIVEEFIDPAATIVWVLPEYNGSFPGVAKVFVDAIHPKHFHDKKAALIGVASGRSGNLRGTDQFTSILHYLKMFVHYSKPKLSGIENLMNDDFRLVDEATSKLLRKHAEMIVKF